MMENLLILLGCVVMAAYFVGIAYLLDLDGSRAARKEMDWYHQIIKDSREQGLSISEQALVLAAFRECQNPKNRH